MGSGYESHVGQLSTRVDRQTLGMQIGWVGLGIQAGWVGLGMQSEWVGRGFSDKTVHGTVGTYAPYAPSPPWQRPCGCGCWCDVVPSGAVFILGRCVGAIVCV